MINAIAKIRGLGVFENYTKPSAIEDFGVKNLIYGWNYSGKTTLSRLFALIALKEKSLDPDLSACSFTIETDDGPVTESNFTKSNLLVRVFNSDFVRDNLNFTGESFKPILLLGSESKEAQMRLDHCDDLLRRTKDKIKEATASKNQLKADYSAARTTTAARIKSQLQIVEAYTAAHLKTDIQTVAALPDSQLLSEDSLQADRKLAITQDGELPKEVDTIKLSPSFKLIHDEAESLLAFAPSLQNTIKHLEDNPSIQNWVEKGLELHPNPGKCEFCGGDVTSQRLTELGAHFSKELNAHKEKLKELHKRAEKSRLEPSIPKAAELNSQFRNQFENAVPRLEKAVETFGMAIDKLEENILKKIESPFKAQQIAPLTEDLDKEVKDAAKAINNIIIANNEMLINFSDAKKNAIKRLKRHYVQEFINEQKQIGRKKKLERLQSNLDRLERFSSTVNNEIRRLTAIISQAHLGRKEINTDLKSILGSEAVQIEVVNEGDDERFQLVRKNGRPARNLSEGEKTAIAFCYFLNKLKELNETQFREAIVYIDDPISSLDANHIFQVTAAIRSRFFHKNSETGAWETTCRQIFLSTHNFEFFNLLREIKPKEGTRAPLFLVKRITDNDSILLDMPKSLSKYSSEYHFLFDRIYCFHSAPDKTQFEVLMLLPNAFRRFVELYTYSRLPGTRWKSVDQRAEELFGVEKSKHILKIFHYFSHANNIERLAGNNELIFDLEYAVRDLLSAIEEQDPRHWEALVEAVS